MWIHIIALRFTPIKINFLITHIHCVPNVNRFIDCIYSFILYWELMHQYETRLWYNIADHYYIGATILNIYGKKGVFDNDRVFITERGPNSTQQLKIMSNWFLFSICFSTWALIWHTHIPFYHDCESSKLLQNKNVRHFYFLPNFPDILNTILFWKGLHCSPTF